MQRPSDLPENFVKGECQNCGSRVEGCSGGNMSNWKSRTREGGKRSKCGTCSLFHRAKSE